MLAAAYLDLIALDAGDLPDSSGYLTYAAILELMSRSMPGLSERLHAPAIAKPFTVSGLLDGETGGPVGQVAAGSRYRIRVTGLETEVAHWVAWLGSGGAAQDVLSVGRMRFEVAAPLPASRDVAEADISSYDALIEPAHEAPRRKGASVTIAFHSPTAFRKGRINIVFPIPELVFGGLRRRWDAFVPPTTAGAFPFPAMGSLDPIMVARHDIRTDMMNFGSRGQQNGFRGTCTFHVKGPGETARMLAVLADFVRFAGVGYRTAWGMGQAHRVEERTE